MIRGASSLRVSGRGGWGVTAGVAVALPVLVAFNLPPSATFFNQAASLVGWGAFLAALCLALPARGPVATRGLQSLQAALALLLLSALAAPLWTGLPWAMALSAIGLLGAAMLTAQVAAAAQQGGLGRHAFHAFCVALVIAGLGSVVVAVVQVFMPEIANDSAWIANSSIAGRAVGNLRQPNHLSSVLLWALIALAWLAESRPGWRLAALPLALPLLFAVVLSGSRTGAIGVVLLALWGLIDTRLSRRVRIALAVAPLLYALLWFGMAQWAAPGGQALGSTARLHESPLGSRRGIWLNSLSMIAAQPWFGVGFGEFNFAWTLTPFPGRPTEFFDHAHNLPLHLAAELGVPLALLVLGLLCLALWSALRSALKEAVPPTGEPPSLQRTALAMVVMVLVHSLVEYPLWYAYFLLPAAFAFGLCVGGAAQPAPAVSAGPQRTRPLLLAAMTLLVGGVFAVQDYLRVAVIFSPREDAEPLAQRIATGQHSIFFAHHADYAAATVATHPSQAMRAFVRAPHFLLDARLMAAWALAFDELGDRDRARFVAQRLHEFRNPQSDEFFARCEAPRAASAPAPFQCAEPEKPLGYRDFRPRP
jgi:O-antigen ligase